MNRWHKIGTIATFEFLTAVKRPGYLIATFGMPLFMAGYAAIVAIPAYFADQAEKEPSVYGVVDSGGVLGLESDVSSAPFVLPDEVKRALEASGQSAAVDRAFMQSTFVFRPFPSEPQARTELAARRIKGYFVVPPDYLASGVIDVYTQDALNLSGGDSRGAFATVIRERLLKGRVDAPASERILKPLEETRRFSVTRSGELTDGSNTAGIVRLAVPLVFMVLFLLSVLMTSGYLMQGTATEKENKVVEVLLASANPDQILSGKLVGLGGAGLLQIAVWLGILLAGGLGVVPLLLAAKIQMPWVALALAIPLFLVSFLFYGSLMLGTGSLGSNMREAQQLAMVWSLTAALPMIMMMVLMRDPHGIVARVMTLVPFSSASLIIFRASTDMSMLAWWEVAAGFAILVLSTWAAIRLGARLFRVGLLSASRPKLSEIIRQARLSA
jgi:ABC-2 type transport system permease protein